MVVTDLPATEPTGVWQARIASPSIRTVQAPHRPAPQPNFVPTRPSSSRSAHRSGISIDVDCDIASVDDKCGHWPASARLKGAG